MFRLAKALGTAIALVACEPMAQARVNIDVDLSSQTMRVAADGGETYVWPISSGKAGHLTPTGRYRPQRMYVLIHSLKYDNAPMPHSIFFRGGYAIHGSNALAMLGRPASHGCIRLAPGNASVLFDLVRRQGASISISGAAPVGMNAVAMNRRHAVIAALGYAPHRRARPLKAWMRDPLAL
jgi:L,D-transpeptidase catalytic domain